MQSPNICDIIPAPITDPFVVQQAVEAFKPPTLPEQKVFNSVEELYDNAIYDL